MTRANPASTPISASKSAALSRILDLVPRGYTRYVCGRCPARKAKALAIKFHQKYGIGCSPAQRITRKQKGLANAVLVLFWPAFGEAGGAAARKADQLPSGMPDELLDELPDGKPNGISASTPPADSADTEVAWLLLVSPGSGPVTEEESLRSVLDAPRLTWLGYELVRLPKHGGAAWTWRRPKSDMTDWYALLAAQLASRQMGAVASTLQRISNQPGFSGVRQQSWELFQFARSRGYAGELPFLFHLQKLPHGRPLRLE